MCVERGSIVGEMKRNCERGRERGGEREEEREGTMIE